MSKIVEFIGSSLSIVNYYNRTPHIWGVNMVGLVIPNCSMHWNMDDLKTIKAGRLIAKMLHAKGRSRIPIMTSRAYPDLSLTVQYPLQEVLNYFKDEQPWFNHTPSYMFPYAIMEGFTEIHLHAFDYLGRLRGHHYLNMIHWVGVCKKHGVNVRTNPACKLARDLFNAKFPEEALPPIDKDMWPPNGEFYGYYPQPEWIVR